MKKQLKNVLCISSYLIALFYPALNMAQDPYCATTQNKTFDNEVLSGTEYAQNGFMEVSNSTVPIEAHLTAGTYILLKPDFQVAAGAIFSAKIEDCVASKPFINIPAANAIMDNGCLDFMDPISWYFEWNEVEGATSYQIRAKNPFFLHPLFDETVSTNYYTFNRPTNNYFSNNQLDMNWVAEVRANVNGTWTPWYGHEGAAALPFTIEPIGTDCPPLMTSPLPQATLDNGCNGFDETLNWDFTWTAAPGATEYQLIVRHPSVNINTIDIMVNTNSYNFNLFSQINTYFTGWTVKVRAKIQGVWTDYYGSTIEDEVMLFNVERVDTDCAPKIVTPSPMSTLANGCIYPENDSFEWTFSIAQSNLATETETRINRPNGSIYTSNSSQWIIIEDEGNDTVHQILRVFQEHIPANELANWSVQARSKINGAWTSWYGDTLTKSRTYFDVASPRTDCAPIIMTPLPNTIFDNGCYNGRNPIEDWYFEWNEVPGATKYDFFYANSTTAIFEMVNTNNYTVNNDGNIPNDELNGWRASVRAFKDGQWTNWYGIGLNQDLNFSVEPIDTDCPFLVATPASSRQKRYPVLKATSIDFEIYPNPFSENLTIDYSLVEDSAVRIEVYSMTGQLMETLINTTQSAGHHAVVFDGDKGFGDGLYLVRLQVGGAIFVKKVFQKR